MCYAEEPKRGWVTHPQKTIFLTWSILLSLPPSQPLGSGLDFSEEDHQMKTGYRHLSFLALTAALLVPAAITTRAAAQDDRRQDDKRQEDTQRNDRNHTRVYDRTHKDYHDWNENEDRSYRQYAGQNHQDYREYNKLNDEQQEQYWKWRHSHPDGDREKHHDDQEKH
jgi:hypothetical protein